MTLLHIHQERASYDQDGNIIILPRSEVIGTDVSPPSNVAFDNHIATVQAVTHRTHQWLDELLSEGRSQYSWVAMSIRSIPIALAGMPSQMRSLLVRFAAIARTPIRIGSRGKTKQRSRLSLFLIDTVRFGGTFALIFSGLFIGINYESFWQIAKADLALTDESMLHDELLTIVNPAPADQISENVESSERSLISYLPRVGPSKDMIIIASLGIIANIVEPSIDSLIARDWKQFESDIQRELLRGVVLYPGSARPGKTGNAFLTGHSSYYPGVDSDYKQIFASLHRLNIGDTYSIYYRGDLFTYRVTEKKEVRPNNVSVLDQPVDRQISTLMTCTPIGTTLRRLIVTAVRIDPETGKPFEVPSSQKHDIAQHDYQLSELPI